MSIASNSTVIILGSTGSIGTQGLDVISRHPERFTVTGLAAGGAHIELLAQQAAQFHVSEVAVLDETRFQRCKQLSHRPAHKVSA